MPAQYETIGGIEVIEDEFHKLIAPDANIEILADGFSWSEGPVWVEDGGFLLFSDVPENTIYKWKEGEGISVYLKPSGFTGEGSYSNQPGSNGLAIDSNGKLILCQHGDRRVARMKTRVNNPSSEFETIAGYYNNKKFNSPNDLAIHQNGDIYFTDPPYGLPRKPKSGVNKPDFNGVFKVSTGDGKVTLLPDDLYRPNGIAFNPEYTVCFVNISDVNNPVTMAYDVNADNGTLENGRVFYNYKPMMQNGPGLPDGLKVHPSGYIFSTGPGGVWVITPEGKHLGTVKTTNFTSNCAFNGDYSFLYMTADNYLLRVKLNNKNNAGHSFKKNALNVH
ncbi:MAG: SMP-30/gluconolactonase/LRE family protein [Bacteroidetes bacterium]|nr:SMP-30/gluconolactonase/LRE family protein [Bacteroidota bacterium]